MRRTLKMPRLGDAADAAVVVSFALAPGARVALGDTLYTVETDKTTVDVPTPAAGVVEEILMRVGDELMIGAPTLALEV